MVIEIDDSAGLDEDAAWRAHSSDLIRYATLLVGPIDAADIVSVAFMRVAASPVKIRKPRAYLMRAVSNAAIDQYRSRQRQQVRDLHAVIATTTIHGREADVDVRRAIAALSVQQRVVVYFTYWEDLDTNQIAELLGITPASVRRHLARARFRLRKVLS